MRLVRKNAAGSPPPHCNNNNSSKVKIALPSRKQPNQPPPEFSFPFERRARSLSNPKQQEIAEITKKIKKDERKSPSPECAAEQRSNGGSGGGAPRPVIAKTDFSLQQQMMGLGRTKDLDEWLMGSGESAETADSKAALQFGNRAVQ